MININIAPTILKRASTLLCQEITNGNNLVATKVRENGNLLEWHLENGDFIEIVNNMDYATGLCLIPSTSICLCRDDEIVWEESYVSPENSETEKKV